MTPMFFKAARLGKPKAKAEKKPDAGATVKVAEPKMEHFSHLLSLLNERGAAQGEFGPHNVKVGHHVAFHAGTFAGAGKVASCGTDGVTVHDEKKRAHRVHWHEVTGFYAGAHGDDDEGMESAEGEAAEAAGGDAD